MDSIRHQINARKEGGKKSEVVALEMEIEKLTDEVSTRIHMLAQLGVHTDSELQALETGSFVDYIRERSQH